MTRFGNLLFAGALIAAPFAVTTPATAQVYVGPAYPYACGYYTPYYCNYGWAPRRYPYGWGGWGYGYPYGAGWGRHGWGHGGYHGGGHGGGGHHH